MSILNDIFGSLKDLISNSELFKDALNNISKGAGGSNGMVALQIINKALESMRGMLSTINDTVERGISQSITNQKQYLGPISSRLQSFETDSVSAYKELSKEVRNVFTNSRYIDQQLLLKNLAQLVQEGVGYNLEDRAYLATIADRTVATFDILNNSTLNRMIRLQQADLTRPQMGAEAFLTKFLNKYYQDTSYLTDMYDNVTGMLMDAISQMQFDQTTGFLFNVQKWMAALYAVGMSDNAINTIVQGLNYLGSGNVNQLTGNSQLNTLFAMSAQQAGLSYSDLLTQGLTAPNVDKLLNSMVKYLQDIANNTNNEILRSEYGRVFGGLSVADLRAIQNLTSGDLIELTNVITQIDYEKGLQEAGNQIKAVRERTSTAEQIENMYNNLIYSIGAEIGENEDAYLRWFYLELSEKFGDYLGGVIPGILGELVANGVGFATEAMKTDEVFDAIKNIDMFNYQSMDDVMQQAREGEYGELGQWVAGTRDMVQWITRITGQNGLWLPTVDSDGEVRRILDDKAIDDIAEKNAMIQNAISNWEYFSQLGAFDQFLFNNWSATTERGGQYSSSISFGDNAFAETESKIKTEEITGIDELYNGLFGDQARPIKVVMVDMDGQVIDTATLLRPQNDFEDVNYNIYSPQDIFNQRKIAQGID